MTTSKQPSLLSLLFLFTGKKRLDSYSIYLLTKQNVMTDLLSEGYCFMPNTVLYNKELTDKQKLLFGAISNLCAEKGYCRASNEYLGELLDASKITISKNVSELQEKGFINVVVSQKDGNQRKITIVENDKSIVKNDNTYNQKGLEGYSQKGQHNNTINNNNINNKYSELYEIYYGKSKGIDTKVCDKLINDKLSNGYTLDDIKQGLTLYNCECRTKGSDAYRYVKKFETRIKEFQPITNEDIARVVSLHKEKSKADEKYAGKVGKTVITDLCEAFGKDRINQLRKSESKTLQLHFT